MILESYLNENVSIQTIQLQNQLLNENIVESISKAWETIKQKFFKFVNSIITKWRNFKNTIRAIRNAKKMADELVKEINRIDNESMNESALKVPHQLCIIRNLDRLIKDMHVDLNNVVDYIMRNQGVSFDKSILKSRDPELITQELNKMNFDNINMGVLKSDMVKMLEYTLLNTSFVSLSLDNDSRVNINIDYSNIYSFAKITDTDQLYTLSDMTNENINRYIKQYDEIYNNINELCKTIMKIKLKQTDGTVLFKYYKTKLFLINEIIGVLIRLNTKIQNFEKNNNLKLMDNENDLILN